MSAFRSKVLYDLMRVNPYPLVLASALGLAIVAAPAIPESPAVAKEMELRAKTRKNMAERRKDIYSTFKMPSRDEMDTSYWLGGLDKDKDGVRDDIQVFIQQNFAKPYQREALSLYAQTTRELFTKAVTREALTLRSGAGQCVMEAFTEEQGQLRAGKAMYALNMLLLNTPQRRHHYKMHAAGQFGKGPFECQLPSHRMLRQFTGQL